MLKAVCQCGEEMLEENLAPYCDRCGKLIEEEMLGDAVQFMVSPGDEDPDGEGPQFLAVMSSDVNGEPDGSHYCKTCTTFLLDQSFIREMREGDQASGEEKPEDQLPEDGEPEDQEPDGEEAGSEESGADSTEERSEATE